MSRSNSRASSTASSSRARTMSSRLSESSESSTSVYPSKENYKCILCPQVKFTCWNEFENHHAQHAVSYALQDRPKVRLKQYVTKTISQTITTASQQQQPLPSVLRQIRLPVVKPIITIQRAASVTLEEPPTAPAAPSKADKTPNQTDSDQENSPQPNNTSAGPQSQNQPVVNNPDLQTGTSSVTSPQTVPTPLESPEEVPAAVRWPGSCESRSPSVSPPTETDPGTSSKDPSKPPEESEGGNPSSLESSVDALIREIHSLNEQTTSVPGPSAPTESAAMPITPSDSPSSLEAGREPSPTETGKEPSTNSAAGQPEKEGDAEEEEEELPRSRGQLRLVPYESLLSPSFVRHDEEDELDEPLPPPCPASASEPMGPMLSIPRQALEDLQLKRSVTPSTPSPSSTTNVQSAGPGGNNCNNNPHPQSQPNSNSRPSCSMADAGGLSTSGGAAPPNVSLSAVPQSFPDQVRQQQQRQQQLQQQTIYNVANMQQYRYPAQPPMRPPQPPPPPYGGFQGTAQSIQASQAALNQQLYNMQAGFRPNGYAAGGGFHPGQQQSQQSALQQVLSRPSMPPPQTPIYGQARPMVSWNGQNNNNRAGMGVQQQQQQILRPHSNWQFVQGAMVQPQQVRPAQQSVPQSSAGQAPFRNVLPATVPPLVIRLPAASAPLRTAAVVPAMTTSTVPTTSQQVRPVVAVAGISAAPSVPSLRPLASNVAPTSTASISPPAQTQPAKRPHAVIESSLSSPNSSGRSAAGAPPPAKVARVSNSSSSETDKDCEVLVVQHKTNGLPVIQSVEGNAPRGCSGPIIVSASGASPVVTTAQQSPSVASLMSNPNITVTPSKNGSSSSVRPSVVDLTQDGSAQPARQSAATTDRLQCQVCNERFESQAKLKDHLELHLKKSLTPSAPVRTQQMNGTVTVTSRTASIPTARATSSSSSVGAQPPTTLSNLVPLASAQPQPYRRPSGGLVSPPSSAATSTSSSNPSGAVPPTLPQQQQPATATASNRSELCIPVVDMARPEVARQMEKMGVELFIPISNLSAGTQNGSFFIPLITAEAIRRGQIQQMAGTTTNPTVPSLLPHLSGVMNLGFPRSPLDQQGAPPTSK